MDAASAASLAFSRPAVHQAPPARASGSDLSPRVLLCHNPGRYRRSGSRITSSRWAAASSQPGRHTRCAVAVLATVSPRCKAKDADATGPRPGPCETRTLRLVEGPAEGGHPWPPLRNADTSRMPARGSSVHNCDRGALVHGLLTYLARPRKMRGQMITLRTLGGTRSCRKMGAYAAG